MQMQHHDYDMLAMRTGYQNSQMLQLVFEHTKRGGRPSKLHHDGHGKYQQTKTQQQSFIYS